ncbi:hypothetical protein ILUMI_07395 [Ignelater luminosus]|uniref:BTB domain-containing protein n=1 Tax=Ignelater luminosus TaxID=2038154 RepID=A0A8K0GEG1_IGNLU|nr:hypothetical protein ILUMI_07395 [Ignelater luminosus]
MTPNNALHLVWDNHLENVSSLFQILYQDNKLVDVTIVCRDGVLRAHKLILSACSPYFERIFHENPCKHPVVIVRGVHYQEMQMLLQYIYKGYIDIPASFLNNLICIASEFEIKGFENFKNFQNNYHISPGSAEKRGGELKGLYSEGNGNEKRNSEDRDNREFEEEVNKQSVAARDFFCWWTQVDSTVLVVMRFLLACKVGTGGRGLPANKRSGG